MSGTSRRPPALVRYRPFPVDALPEPVRGTVTVTALAIGCDPSFVALPLLSGLASAIGNTRRIQLKRAWTEPAVIWTAIVGESGTKKSPAMDVPLEPVRKRQSRAMADHKQRMIHYQVKLGRYKKKQELWEQNGGVGPKPKEPRKPVCERFWCSDITVEALADRLAAAPRGLLLIRDELAGWLRSFGQYKGGRGGDVSHWLTMFGARDLLVDRKTGDKSTIYVPRAAVSITGGIQPQTLRDALGQEHFEDGLAARLLLSMPPRSINSWTDKDIPPRTITTLAKIFDGLWALNANTDANGDPCPVLVDLSPGAKRVWVDYYKRHNQEQAQLTGDLAAAWSKLEGYAARLALVIHFARWAYGDPKLRNPDIVDARSMEAGVQLAGWFGNEAQRVYAALEESGEERGQRELVELIDGKGGRISARGLMQASRRHRGNAQDAKDALDELHSAGLGKWVKYKNGGKGGRPVTKFRLFKGGNGNTTRSAGSATAPARGKTSSKVAPPAHRRARTRTERPVGESARERQNG